MLPTLVSKPFLDAFVDAIHDFADSILDAHSNLDVDANLIAVDFLVVDHDVHLFLGFDAVEVDVVYLLVVLSLSDVDVLLLLSLLL